MFNNTSQCGTASLSMSSAIVEGERSRADGAHWSV